MRISFDRIVKKNWRDWTFGVDFERVGPIAQAAFNAGPISWELSIIGLSDGCNYWRDKYYQLMIENQKRSDSCPSA